jgi:SAM-dependent methyltransferase
VAFSVEILSPDVLRRLHPSAIEDRDSIRAVLERLWRDQIPLQRGLNREITPEIARIERLAADFVVLRKFAFGSSSRPQLWLNFELEGRRHFFAASILDSSSDRVTAAYPDAIYQTDRRDRMRTARAHSDPTLPKSVQLSSPGHAPVTARVTDVSDRGLGVIAPDGLRFGVGAELRLRYLDGSNAGVSATAQLRNRSPAPEAGWLRLGVSLLEEPTTPIRVFEAPTLSWTRLNRTLKLGATALAHSLRSVRPLGKPSLGSGIATRDFENAHGERIRALIDRTTTRAPGSPVVVIPPAWGRTKETLLPLAATIIATFEAASEPVTVVRFDGIRKRGESHNDEVCRTEGAEHHRFTFSQGVDDIRSVIRGLGQLAEFRQSPIVLVTFSAASIDGRRAVATDTTGRVAGWVSVVGSADLQSMMRVVSGGVDYVGGVERGIEFGLQEILGVEVDIDLAGRDALEQKLAFLEDACRDMQQTRVPVSWIHGRFDAWMDLERARAMLGSGNASNRRLIVVPTGHQLRTSREAIEVFQLVSGEIGRMVLGRELPERVPSLRTLESKRVAERARLPKREVDRRGFWRNYLLGRDGSLGIELMTNASSYRSLMVDQIDALELKPGHRVADLGSGTGSFLAELGMAFQGILIHELDYVKEALIRARARHGATLRENGIGASFVACDLGGSRGLSFPCRDGSFDAVLASLFISYVDDPDTVLREIRRILRPDGRLVLSGLRRDADLSKLFVDAVAEIRRGEGASRLREGLDYDLARLSRNFLNDAARLLDLEEDGFFRFRDARETTDLLKGAGFSVSESWQSFGDPPQAVVVAARRIG